MSDDDEEEKEDAPPDSAYAVWCNVSNNIGCMTIILAVLYFIYKMVELQGHR